MLKRLLQLETIICNEINIFDACLSWAKVACQRNDMDESIGENLRIQLGDCFDLIRFGTMDIMEFAIHASSCKDLFQLGEIKDILFTITNKEVSKFIQKERTVILRYFGIIKMP